MTSALLRHWNSVFSRGVGYEHTPPGRYVDNNKVRGYYIDFSAKTTSPSAAHAAGLLPAALAQLALGWWERMLAGESGAEGRFREICALLERSATADGGALVWHYHIVDHKYHVPPPMISALAQAQAASVFVRCHLLEGEERYAELALQATRPMVQDEPPSIVAHLDTGPALEESPSNPPSLILNGWIYALWGLRDVSLGLGDTNAAGMYESSMACLVATLPRYDAGWWSRYSLYPHRLADLAKPFYHRLHVDQLEVMSRITGKEEFQVLANRWRKDDTHLKRMRLIAQKVAFVASGYR